MGRILDMARDIAGRRELTRAETERHVYEALLEFHGINDISISGPRTLFYKLKAIVKAVVLENCLIQLFTVSNGTTRFCDITEFEQRLAEEMSKYV